MSDQAQDKISIITPLYNSARFIRATLDSICQQTYENWESILIDDGSTDETADVIAPYLRDRRFTYIKQRNQGIAGARNTGLAAARGGWVCLLDHDDRWLPTKLEKQLALAVSHAYDLVSTNAIIVKGAAQVAYDQLFRPGLIAELEQSEREKTTAPVGLIYETNFLCASSVMIRRSLFERFGYFDAEAAPADDYEMWLRCAPEVRLGYLSEPLVEYVLHESNFSHNDDVMSRKTVYALQKSCNSLLQDGRRSKHLSKCTISCSYSILKKLLRQRDYLSALGHTAPFLVRGWWGLEVLYWTLDRYLLGAFFSSLTSPRPDLVASCGNSPSLLVQRVDELIAANLTASDGGARAHDSWQIAAEGGRKLG